MGAAAFLWRCEELEGDNVSQKKAPPDRNPEAP